jgi:hypothetical protein
MRRSPSVKKFAEYNLDNVPALFYELYKRMTSHVDFVFTEEMALATLVRAEDMEFVKRSAALYGHMRSTYYGSSALEIVAPSHANDAIYLTFNKHCSFVPPAYLAGKKDIKSFNPEFAEVIWPWLEQTVPLREMYRTAMKSWFKLKELTDNDYARIRALWPTVDALSSTMGRPVPKLPVPKGLPSPSPELREALTVTETFVNAALMMPEKKFEPDYPIMIALGTSDWR